MVSCGRDQLQSKKRARKPYPRRANSICMDVFWAMVGIKVMLFVAGITGLRRLGLAGLARVTNAGLAGSELRGALID